MLLPIIWEENWLIKVKIVLVFGDWKCKDPDVCKQLF